MERTNLIFLNKISYSTNKPISYFNKYAAVIVFIPHIFYLAERVKTKFETFLYDLILEPLDIRMKERH